MKKMGSGRERKEGGREVERDAFITGGVEEKIDRKRKTEEKDR